jgi:hypothetical protein
MNREERAIIATYIQSHPLESYPAVSRAYRLSYSTVCRIAQEFQIVRPTGRKMPSPTATPMATTGPKTPMEAVTVENGEVL